MIICKDFDWEVFGLVVNIDGRGVYILMVEVIDYGLLV